MTDSFDAPPPGPGDQPSDYVQPMAQQAGLPAEFVPRLLAYFIDGLIAFASYLPGFILIFFGLAIGGGFGVLIALFGTFLMFIGFLAFLYMIVMNLAKTGQTPGKRTQGIKVVLDSGQPLGVGNAVIRFLLLGFLNSVVFGLPIGSLWMLWDQDKKTLYDKILNMSSIQVPSSSLMPMFPNGKPF